MRRLPQAHDETVSCGEPGVARDSGHNTIAFISDAVDGRSAATRLCGKTSLFYRSDPRCAAARQVPGPRTSRTTSDYPPFLPGSHSG
eukprot:2433893-Prymnesium_polylepis.1